MKKILFVASEGVPFIKTGGLADVVGSLPKEIDKKYFDVRVIIPKYSCMRQEMKDKMQYLTHFYMDYNLRLDNINMWGGAPAMCVAWQEAGNLGKKLCNTRPGAENCSIINSTILILTLMIIIIY